jgi:hypothetical protein
MVSVQPPWLDLCHCAGAGLNKPYFACYCCRQQRARARSRAIARAGACCTSRSRAQHRKSLMHSLQHSACGLGNGRREGFTRRCRVAAGAASATAAAMSVLTAFASMSQAAQPSLGAASPLATTWNTPALLTSLGIFLLCAAAAAFLICAIPTLWEMRRVARRTEAVLTQVSLSLDISKQNAASTAVLIMTGLRQVLLRVL